MRTSIQVLGLILAVISLTIASDLAVPENRRNGSKEGSNCPGLGLFGFLSFTTNIIPRGILPVLHCPVPQPAMYGGKLHLHLRDLLHQLRVFC